MLNSKLSLSHLQQLIWDQTQINTRTEHLEAHAHLNQQVSLCPHRVQSVRLLLFKGGGGGGGDNARWISMNKMAATAVQWELCGTNFRENIANLWVSCFNGNNDRSARVLFVQHPREQGEWLRQNPRYARVLTASFDHSPCSLGCWTNNTLAAWSSSPNHINPVNAIYIYIYIYIYTGVYVYIWSYEYKDDLFMNSS